MITTDHIGADPALGIGAGQTRRSTPVDLAREVLDLAHEDEIVTVCSVPDNKAAALASAVQSLTAEVDAYREETTRLREQVTRIKALAERSTKDDFALAGPAKGAA